MRKFVIALLVTWFTGSGFANAAKVEQVWQLDGHEQEQGDFFNNSIKRLAALPGFQCRFDQMMVFTDGGGQRYSGQVAVLKPKRFRWQYDQPYEQFYIGDGRSIWHYEPDLMQAERLDSLESVDPAVMKLLDGTVRPADIEVLSQEMNPELDIRRYKVSIQGSEPVWLGFSKYGDLVLIEREDLLGNRNRMHLSECSYIAPAENLFSFTPPEGVDLLDMRSVIEQ